MTTVDRVQLWRIATVAIIESDGDLRTQMGRNTDLITPWESLTLDEPLPIIAYQALAGTGRGYFPTRLRAQFSVFGASEGVCNTVCERLDALLRNPAYTLQGLDVGRDNASPPDRQWPGADPRQDDAATARADIDITFLIAG
jgi:hypothetical protein